MSLPSIKEFKPLNGRICIELMQYNEMAWHKCIWRIVSIADNANLEHYKNIKVNDLVVADRNGYKLPVGHISFIKPGDIYAIYPAA